jgi:hypothetical protein
MQSVAANIDQLTQWRIALQIPASAKLLIN